MKILVADDNPVCRNVLQKMLTGWGYDVVVAADGNQAWALLQAEGGPRLAILDWMMPGMDGVEVCRRVRESAYLNYVYVLILTSKAQSEGLLVAMEAGSDDYVTKPFQSKELRTRLRVACRILELREELALIPIKSEERKYQKILASYGEFVGDSRDHGRDC